MDRPTAIAELLDAYATALRVRDEQPSNIEIAARLSIEPEAVAPLLRIAAAKLRVILVDDVARSPQIPEEAGDPE